MSKPKSNKGKTKNMETAPTTKEPENLGSFSTSSEPTKTLEIETKSSEIPKVSAESAALATPEPKALAIEQDVSSSWGFGDISNQHLLLPRILVMQGLSKFVGEGMASVGELRDSLDCKKLGDKNTPMEFIVFHCDESVVTYELEDDVFEYRREEKRNANNADLPFESEDGRFRYDNSLNFYCLLPHDIASGEPFPFVISFRRTSFGTGKKLFTQLTKLKMFRKPSAAKAFKLKTKPEENEKGKYFVFDLLEEKRDTTPAEVQTCFQWFEIVSKSVVKIDDTDLKDSTKVKENFDLRKENF